MHLKWRKKLMKHYLKKSTLCLVLANALLFTSIMPIKLADVNEKNIAKLSLKKFINLLGEKHLIYDSESSSDEEKLSEEHSNAAQILASYFTKENLCDLEKTVGMESLKSINKRPYARNKVQALIKKDKNCAIILAKLFDESTIYEANFICSEIIKAAPFTAKIFVQLINKINIRDEKNIHLRSVIEYIVKADASCAAIIVKNAIPEMDLQDIDIKSTFFDIVCSLVDADQSLFNAFAQWKGFSTFEKAYKKECQNRERGKREREEILRDIKKKIDKVEEEFYQYRYGNVPVVEIPSISKDEAYKTLGLSDSASLKEIKTAYKKLSMQYHPDHNKNKSELEQKEAEKKMIEINAAYEVLGRRSKL